MVHPQQVTKLYHAKETKLEISQRLVSENHNFFPKEGFLFFELIFQDGYYSTSLQYFRAHSFFRRNFPSERQFRGNFFFARMRVPIR